MGERDKDALALLTYDVDLFHAWHMQQALAQRFGITYQQSLRLAFGFQGKQRKGHICKLIVDHRANYAGR